MRNRESSIPTIEREEPEGIEAEKGIADFLAHNFSCITAISRERSDQDDKNGIDMVADIEQNGEIHKLALEVSGPGDERKKEKVERQWRMPIVCLHNNKGEVIGESMPRVLIGFNVGYFLSRQKEAERLGVSINDVLSDNEKHGFKGEILGEILGQINILAADHNFFKAIKPVRKAFEKEQDELEELGI